MSLAQFQRTNLKDTYVKLDFCPLRLLRFPPFDFCPFTCIVVLITWRRNFELFV